MFGLSEILMNTEPLRVQVLVMILFLTKVHARRYRSAEHFVRSSLMNIGGEEPFRCRLAANTASRTFRVVNFTITGGASVELVDLFRRCDRNVLGRDWNVHLVLAEVQNSFFRLDTRLSIRSVVAFSSRSGVSITCRRQANDNEIVSPSVCLKSVNLLISTYQIGFEVGHLCCEFNIVRFQLRNQSNEWLQFTLEQRAQSL